MMTTTPTVDVIIVERAGKFSNFATQETRERSKEEIEKMRLCVDRVSALHT